MLFSEVFIKIEEKTATENTNKESDAVVRRRR